MSAFATGATPVVRVIEPRSRRVRRVQSDVDGTTFVEHKHLIPSSTAQMWRTARRFAG